MFTLGLWFSQESIMIDELVKSLEFKFPYLRKPSNKAFLSNSVFRVILDVFRISIAGDEAGNLDIVMCLSIESFLDF